MSEEKIRVKDITAELGVSNKEMLAALRELGIPAKSHMAALSPEDAGRVRERFAAPNADAEKIRRETQSGVIVRRRRRSAEPVAEPAVEQADTDAPKAASAEEKAAAGEKSATTVAGADATAVPEKTSDAASDIAPKDAPAKKTAKAATGKKAPAQRARIVRRAGEEEPQHAAEAQAPTGVAGDAQPEAVSDVAVAASEKEQAKPARASKANVSAEPERGADGAAVSSAPVLATRSDREGGDEGPENAESRAPATHVRVISRPAPGQRPPRGAAPSGSDARPGASRPATPRPGGRPPSGPRPPASPVPEPVADAGAKKKRGKGRRTVEFEFSGEDHAKRRREMEAGSDGAWRGKGKRKGKGREAARQTTVTQPIKAAKRKIRMDEFIRVSDLAHQMGLKSTEIIKVLLGLGVMATINQSLDVDTATLVAAEFEYEVEKVGFSEGTFLEEQETDAPESLRPRPPVVTIMGHVDHGKTSLLDAIRKSSVVSGEAGGITQHIGAYNVKTKKGQIVFLDTPGHEAFTAMRARGAEVTDIVVLVVAADDGVMEQTREAISHAKAAGVPIMVAVNKMDKEEANPDRVKRELADQGLVPEEWGGETTFSYVSAKQRQGIDDLLELIALQAEILELKANPDKGARGHIIEAKLDKGRGSLGTVLIQHGTLKVGDAFVCGVHFGRVRAMFDDQGKKIKSAGPSMPVEVQGFEGVPEAGEEFISIADEKAARRIAETRFIKQREKVLAKESRVTLETFLSRKADAVEALTLNLVIKADVQGSLEAIVDAMNKLSTEKVRLHIIHTGAGAISESDVLLASASDAIIIGFNVRPTPKAKELIEQEKIDTRFYDIIYKLVEEIRSAMEGLLAPVEKEVYLGLADVRDTFSVPKVGVIAGCHVADGKIVRNAQVRLLRDNVVIYTGKITSLKRFKDDAREVLKGYECGIGLERFNDIKVGDSIEAFEIVEEAASL